VTALATGSTTLEHTDVLGETVEEIARDKAHVAPGNAPLVTAATGDALEAVRDVAGNVLLVGETNGGDGAHDVSVTYGGRNGPAGRVDLAGPDWSVEADVALLGAHQARNAGVAAALARQVAAVDGEELARGLRHADWPGRFEVVGRDPLVVLDGAHNPGGCVGVTETLAEFDHEECHLVVGAMCDKDHSGMAAALPEAATVVACEPDVERAEDADVLAAAFREEMGDATDVEVRRAVPSALEHAVERADEDDCVLVVGSLYAVAEARTRWTRPMVPTDVRDLDDASATLSGANVTDAGVWRMRAKGVHRVLQTRVRHRQASYLKEELLSLGGECAISGIRDDEEFVDIVMMGTLAQFKRLTEKLTGQPFGLAPFADELRAALDIQHEPVEHGYPWESGTAVMGILNVTPDSFHDGGRYEALEDAADRAAEMVDAGADIVDVGGESTRPGATPVPVEAERDRVVPVIERVSDLDALVSVDTRKPAVARAALEVGADIVNDVSGLEDPEMAAVAADHDAPVVVMHSVETPVDPDRATDYDDVVADAIDELRERVLRAERAGLDRSQVVVDPGLGFGKSAAESFELLGRVDEFHALGCPVLVGHSHKSMFELVDRGPEERRAATVAATALAAERGADIVRVHDVEPNVAAVRTAAAADDAGAFGGQD